MIWITSDLHFCHDKDFIYGARGFSSVNQMNETIINNWNELICPEDDIYVLGDIMLDDNVKGIECWNQLIGNKHIILGNHDSTTRVKLYKQCPRTRVEGYGLLKRYKEHSFFLSHYPTLTWNNDDNNLLKNRVINLCGHVHTADRYYDSDKGLIYHVELDAHNNRPITMDSVLNDIIDRFDK